MNRSNTPSFPARAWRAAAAAALGAGLALAAGAQQPAPQATQPPPQQQQILQPQAGSAADPSGDLGALSTRWLNDAVQAAQVQGGANAMPLRMEVSVGSLDPRLRLAPCNRVEPYLPIGSRLWGRTRLGLRCLDGATHWNVFLPVTVKAIGPAWVLRDGVAPGAVLKPGDAVQAEADWAADASPVVADPAQWVGRVATRGLAAGQPIRQSMVRTQQVMQAGAAVRVLAGGQGFEVSTEGQTLSAGAVGEPVRVRMPNGRIATGQVVDAGTVRLAL